MQCYHEIEHINYPHYGGDLQGCEACETSCHCVDGFICIGCILLREAMSTSDDPTNENGCD